MDKKTITKIFETFHKENQTPAIELKYINAYTLLVAVVLSAQSTDVNVNKATEDLFKIVKTPEDMLKLGEEKLKHYIKSIGLFNNKAKNIMLLSDVLIKKYNSTVPQNIKDLMSLPGVGSKSARVVLNTIYKQPYMAVDTHVFRVSRRIGISDSDNVTGVEQDLEKNIPEKWHLYAHHWLVLHGRYVCKARKPLCEECIISKYCDFFKEQN